MDSISVQGDVIDVKPDSTHILVTENTLFRSPLESSNNRVLDFIQVLDSLGGVNNNVGSHGVWTETPNLSGFSDVIFVFVSQVTTTDLESQKQILLFQLQFQKGTVHFVHQENRLDPLGDGLREDGLSLDAHT